MRNCDRAGAYVEEDVVSDGQVFSVDHFVLHLALGLGHQVADSDFHILGPVSLDVFEFQAKELSIEPGQHGCQEELLSFEVEVVDGKEERPDVGGAFCNGGEIRGGGDESESEPSSEEDEGLSSGVREVLVVGRYLFCAQQIGL